MVPPILNLLPLIWSWWNWCSSHIPLRLFLEFYMNSKYSPTPPSVDRTSELVPPIFSGSPVWSQWNFICVFFIGDFWNFPRIPIIYLISPYTPDRSIAMKLDACDILSHYSSSIFLQFFNISKNSLSTPLLAGTPKFFLLLLIDYQQSDSNETWCMRIGLKFLSEERVSIIIDTITWIS